MGRRRRRERHGRAAQSQDFSQIAHAVVGDRIVIIVVDIAGGLGAIAGLRRSSHEVVVAAQAVVRDGVIVIVITGAIGQGIGTGVRTQAAIE